MNQFVSKSLFLAALLMTRESAAQVAIGANFDAMGNGGTPPDSQGAVGPEHFAILVNNAFRVFEKDGQLVESISDTDFWLAAEGIDPPIGNPLDPRLIYDPDSQRWFAVAGIGGQGNTLFVGVSNNSDPTTSLQAGGGGWKAIAVTGTGMGLSDFPTMGISGDALYVNVLPSNDAASFVVIPKADLLALPGPVSASILQVGAEDTHFPVTDIDNALPVHITIAQDGLFERIDIMGLDPPTVLPPMSVINDEFAFPPPNLVQQPPIPCDSGNDPEHPASTIRPSSTVILRNGVIWGVHPASMNIAQLSAAIRFFKIDATTNALIDSQLLGGYGMDFIYPSLAVNENGDVVIGCNGLSESTPPTPTSSFAFVGRTIDGVTSFSEPILLRPGTDDYNVTLPSGTKRWGDYTATTLDPSDSSRFWTIQQVVDDDNSYTLQVSELIVDSGGLCQWQQTAATVCSRGDQGMAYDLRRGVTVVFSGNLASVCFRDPFGGGDPDADKHTWEYDGTAWAKVFTGGPAPRHGHAMAYDVERGLIVMFGGEDNQRGGLSDDGTWTWDGNTWTVVPANSPGPRTGHAMVYDSERQTIVLYGGRDDTGLKNDFWEWDGTNWTERQVLCLETSCPTAREGHSMVYDEDRDVIVIFGGEDIDGLSRETFELSDSFVELKDESVTGPRPRRDHAMIYDVVRGVTVLFGGEIEDFCDGAATANNETWEWEGTRWNPRVHLPGPAAKPDARFGHDLVLDTHRGALVMYGDATASGPALKVWETYGYATVDTNPYDQTVNEGVSVSLSVTATAEAGPFFRWTKDGVPLRDGGTISGAKTATLTIDPVMGDDAGSYRVLVADHCGSVASTAATLDVWCAGDANGDCVVNVLDLIAVNNNMGPCPSPPTHCEGDLNNDGVVDEADRDLVIEHWGEACPELCD